MRVCFISPDAGRGAVGRGIVELVDGLRQLGIESAAVVPAKGLLARALRRRRIPVAWLPVPWWTDRYDTLAGRMARSVATVVMAGPFAVAIRRLGCDVVYTHTVNVPVGALAARLCGVPHVWHLHEFGWEDHRLHFDLGFERAARMVDALSAACITVSNAVADKFKHYIPAEKLHTVYQSVSVVRDAAEEERALKERAASGRAFRIVVVGEIKETKGQADAVLATGELVAKGVDAELLLVGDVEPRYGETLLQLADGAGVQERVRFLGWLDNPYPVVRSADAAVVCSRAEAFGRVTVEAMLAGKPVVGARAGATPELVREGFSGLLYKTGDFRDLARQLLFLAEHPWAAQEMGANGLRWATERFTPERYARDVAQVLSGISAA